MDILWALIRTVRPRQWVKNLSLYAALIFSGFLFFPGFLGRVTLAAIVFTLLTSGVYLLNDLLDLEADRKHPFKKKRPLPSGQLPIPIAIFAMITCFVVGLFAAYGLSFYFFLICLTYLLFSGILYTFWFKKIAIVDVLIIALGYILRVYAGAVVVELHMDVWFLLTVTSASLFLAVGKRRSEMTLLGGNTAATRSTLKHYPEALLNIYTSMFATSTWLTYALFSFNHPRFIPQGKLLTIFADLPRTFLSEKWLMATVPLVIYGVLRYLQLVYERNEGESPERVLLSDRPLITTVSLWGLLVIALIYIVGA